MVKKFKTVTPSLKSTFLEAREAKVRKVDANEIKVNGKDITSMMGLNLPNDYPKLVTRCELPEDKFWGLYDDNAKLLYFNKSEDIINGSYLFQEKNITSFTFPLNSLTNGYMMFNSCINLTTWEVDLSSLETGQFMFYNAGLESFSSDLSSLKNATRMFYNCKNLSIFDSDLTSLETADYMFLNCKLNSESIQIILESLPTYSSGLHEIYLSIQDSQATKDTFNLITGNTSNIPFEAGCGYGASVNYKGWTIICTVNNPNALTCGCGGCGGCC